MAALHFTKDNFEKEVLQSDVPVLVDFWATWCGPCQMVLPIIEELSEELTGVKIGKVNVDEEMELAKQYRIMSIPTLIVFKDGKKVNMAVGAQGKEEIKALLVDIKNLSQIMLKRQGHFVPAFLRRDLSGLVPGNGLWKKTINTKKYKKFRLAFPKYRE